MPQFIVVKPKGEIEIKCPICDSLLSTVKKQDERVHIMLHPMAQCKWANVKFRVDRLWGNAEPWPEEAESDDAPTESA